MNHDTKTWRSLGHLLSVMIEISKVVSLFFWLRGVNDIIGHIGRWSKYMTLNKNDLALKDLSPL
jgi:hypothetical protein